MIEVELKVAASHDSLRETLRAIGADHLGSVTQVDVYFDAPVRDFSATDEALRLRRERGDDGERVELAYKGPKLDDDTKTREELQTVVGDHGTMRAILEAVDFDPVAAVEKTRDRYRYGGFTVSLDSVDGLGEFVEVETMVDSDRAIDENRNRALEVLDDLGVDAERQIRRSYLELLLDGGPSVSGGSTQNDAHE